MQLVYTNLKLPLAFTFSCFCVILNFELSYILAKQDTSPYHCPSITIKHVQYLGGYTSIGCSNHATWGLIDRNYSFDGLHA